MEAMRKFIFIMSIVVVFVGVRSPEALSLREPGLRNVLGNASFENPLGGASSGVI